MDKQTEVPVETQLASKPQPNSPSLRRWWGGGERSTGCFTDILPSAAMDLSLDWIILQSSEPDCIIAETARRCRRPSRA